MAIAYAFNVDALYLNITNRCTNDCVFCVKKYNNFHLGPINLRLETEPSEEEILDAIRRVKENTYGGSFGEIVFCGFGEPLIRLESVLNVAKRLKGQGEKLRINTNGTACLYHKFNVVPSLHGLIDAISVSLNAESAQKYLTLSNPIFGAETYDKVKEFILECKNYIPKVTASVVGATEKFIDIEECRRITTDELKVNFKVR